MEVSLRGGGKNTKFFLLAVDDGWNGYNHVLICSRRDVSSAVACTRTGIWSEWAIQPYRIDGRDQLASVRFKLLSLSPDGRNIKLYRSQITYVDGFSFPPEAAVELVRRFGPYQEHASFMPYKVGMVDFDTSLQECEYQGRWFADAANYLLHQKGCSYFTCHWHLFDYLNHIHLHGVDPVSPGYDPDTADEMMDLFRRSYQVADRILGKLWEGADPETYVGIVSDHGAAPDIRVANLRKFLFKRGFLVLKQNIERIEEDWAEIDDIDWTRSTAYLKAEKGFDIYINAPPGPEFHRIEKELLLALRTWVDEEAGCNPIAIALPKRDAYLLGQWGDQCGDVVFVWNHGYVSGYLATWKGIRGNSTAGAPEVYAAHHGGFLPTETEISSTFGTFILAGPGLKRGYERPTDSLGYIHMADIVPTCCHIFGIQPPDQSQGAVAYDLFEGHQMKRKRQDEL